MTIDSPSNLKQARQEDGLSELGIGMSPDIDLPLIPLPILTGVSGLYEWKAQIVFPQPIPVPFPVIPIPDPILPEPIGGAENEALSLPPFLWRREELRLDVDGRYPQMTVSGTLYSGFAMRVHWIASVRAVRGGWAGTIWFKDGSTAALPFTNIRVTAVRSWFPSQRTATATFTGGGAAPLTRTYSYKSAYYHPVEFEYDRTLDSNPVLAIDTCDHPNHPASIACETISLQTVYRRAGFDTTVVTSTPTIIPKALAGSEGKWTDGEMHDAMQVYWSRFANAPQWAMWVFWAAEHQVYGNSLGGIMFDDIGPNHRQGTAIFTEAFIKNPPPGDADPVAWVKRMRFWTAAHEMGHGFNLAHSWDKAEPVSWIPLVAQPEARSFMNYPYNVSGGQAAFFADFPFRFSDQELLFMRHAPSRFVQMGNADWFDHHGFEEGAALTNTNLRLQVRANRDIAEFEFLEPVVLEVKLTNVGDRPEILDNRVLQADNLTVILQQRGRRARQWTPYARYCLDETAIVLQPGQSCYERLPVFAGLNGWDISEPGTYTVQVAASVGALNVISNALQVRIKTPASRDEEIVAQDILVEDVGRTLAFGGTQSLLSANDALQEATNRLAGRRIAVHAEYAVASPRGREYKLLDLKSANRFASAVDLGGKVVRVPPEAGAKAIRQVQSVLTEGRKAAVAAETFGHIGYKQQVDQLSAVLDSQGETASAATCQREMLGVLKQRKVLDSVLAEVEQKANALAASSRRELAKAR